MRLYVTLYERDRQIILSNGKKKLSRVVVVVVFEVKTLNTRSLSDCFDQLCLDSWDSKYGCRLRQIVAEDIYVRIFF